MYDWSDDYMQYRDTNVINYILLYSLGCINNY
jgi:hypothetical protein